MFLSITSCLGTCHFLRLLAGFSMLLLTVAAHGDNKGEFLLFPSIAAAQRSGIPAGDELKRRETEGAVDFLVTGNFNSIQYLGEYNYSSHEKELARLQAGWRSDGGTVLSIGKFHNLQGYWNTQFHHGAYLQTAISRPGMIEDDGPLPTHYMGMQLDGKLSHPGLGSLDYSLGIGKGALFDKTLDSPDILRPHRDGDLTIGLRLAYSLEEGDPSQVGIFLASNKIPAKSDDLTEIKQTVWGVFGNWENENFRLIGEIYAFENSLTGICSPCKGSFASAYVQGEYRASPALTFYTRVEDTFGSAGDSYLALLPEFVKRRSMAGLRYDLTAKQAIKLELSHVGRVETGFEQVQIQWSAVFP
jgi:hypothetical protein